jgi:hypothetical protein
MAIQEMSQLQTVTGLVTLLGGTGYQPVLSANLPDSFLLGRKAGRQVANRNGQVARSTRKASCVSVFSATVFSEAP